MANIIYKIDNNGTDYNLASSAYCTCATAANTAAKIANLLNNSDNSFVLSTGITVHIKFTNSNTANNPTLNINGTGAKSIIRYGSTSVGTTISSSWRAGAIVSFTYDGENWVMNTGVDDNNIYDVNNATITLAAGNGLTGGESFTTNQGSNETITFNVGQGDGITVAADKVSHADTSSVSNLTATNRTYVKSLTFDNFGHVTGYTTGTETVVDTNDDTKNTTGSTNKTSTKMYVIGATEQSANPVTYSNSNIYVGSDNCLYSNGKKVLVTTDKEELESLIGKALVFRGTLGTNGTITELPTASASTLGSMYKVVTVGTYNGISAIVGDAFICYTLDDENYDWVILPAGDDVDDTWRAIKVNGTEMLGNGISTGALNFKNGTNVSITKSGNDLTISAIDTDTHYTSRNIVADANTDTTNTTAAIANGKVYLNHIENGVVTSAHKISGTGGATVTADVSGNIIINAPSGDITGVTAGTGLSGGGTSGSVTINHADSLTAGTVSDGGSTRTLGWGGTFKIPSVTYNSTGHITSTGTITLTMPANPNTDTNTSHAHSAGVGLTSSGSAGTGGGTYTYKAKLRSETALTIDSAAATTTTGRVYPVVVDKSGYLAVNVPWTDENTTYSLVGAQNTTGLVKNGSSVTSTSGLTACPIISGIPYYKNTTYSSLKNPHALSFKANSETSAFISYDGSAAKTITVAPSSTDGAFTISDGSTTKTIQLAGNFTNTTYQADRGISLVSGKFGHSNTAITAQSTKGLYKISYDTYGHITGTEAFTLPTKSSWNYDDTYVKYSAAQSLTAAQKTQARANIGAGTSSFSGSYNDLTNKPSIPNPANYYWGNIKVSSTSSTATTPSVQKIGITGSTTTTAAAAVTMEYDSSYKALKFVFA